MSAVFRRAFSLAAAMLILLPIAARGFDLSAGLKGGVAMPFYSGPGYTAWLSDVGLTPNLPFRFGGGLFITVGMADLLALQAEVFHSVLGGLSGSSDYALWRDKMPALDGQLLLKLRFRLRGFKRWSCLPARRRSSSWVKRASSWRTGQGMPPGPGTTSTWKT